MLKIDHPQVYIYSYQLSRKSKTEANSIWAWANNICQYFSPESDLILPNEDLKPILSKANKFSHSNKINGSFRFCRLDDSEGILARIGSPETDENKDLEITELKEFNANETILSRSYDNWLGQTIFITYKSKAYQNSSKDFLRGVADECLKYLFPESQRPPFYRATKLFDSHIFEYSSPQSQLQVFVYRIDDEIQEKLGNILQPLFELLYHRHKITKAFLDSRKTHELANKLYTDIENTFEDLETKIVEKKERYLQELKTNVKELLHESLHYQKTLQALEDFDNTISIHVYNCQQKLSQISDKCEIQPEALTTFNLFIEKTSPYFQRQIQGDLGYFKHGTNLIETAIASIRGIVEIEQAESDRLWQEQEKDRDRALQQTLQNNEINEKKRDRNLQTIVAVVGVGIGAAGVAATASPYIIEEPKPNQTITIIPVHLQPTFGINPPHPLTLSLLFSLAAGLLGVAIAARVMRHLQKQEKKELHRIIKLILKLILGNPEPEPATTTESNKGLPNSQSEEVVISQPPAEVR